MSEPFIESRRIDEEPLAAVQPVVPVAAEPVVVAPAAPMVQHRVVETPPVVERRVVETAPAAYPSDVVSIDRRWQFSVATFLGIIAGAVLIILGVVAIARGDLKGSINDPVVGVAGWDHTPLLGLIEIAAGIFLLLSAFAAGAEMFFGAFIAVFGIIALVEPKVLSDNLEIASSLAWVFIALGAIPAAAAAISTMAVTRVRRTTVARVQRV
jgi:hypothetical protein